ncbi:MAG TPA: single-stranded DNA-binding protein [Blastocatellia bacterium]|nr:single-stranded DNA-binding protein [Blastocatellia bacterium]
MASFNKITIVGYLGRDPELRYTPDGTPVCDFSVATTERRKDRSGEQQEITTWFRVTVWRKLAEIAGQYLAKGKQVYVEGRLIQREYQDRDGHTKYSLEVTASEIQFLGARGDDPQPSRAAGAGAQARQETESAAPVTEDDIPF